MPEVEPERILFVEGEDDQHVVEHLRKVKSLPEFAVRSMGGHNKLIDAIGNALRVDGREVLGILMDADDNVDDAWRCLANRFAEEGVTIPSQSQYEGTLLDHNHLRIGIWLMPDNRSPGELEDFFKTMIPQDDPAWLCADEYIQCIPDSQRAFKEGKLLRAKVHAWLATREVPGRMGAAIGAGKLQTDGPLAQKFANWLRGLFG